MEEDERSSKWVSLANKYCSSWQELRKFLIFTKVFDYTDIIDSYIVKKEPYRRNIFRRRDTMQAQAGEKEFFDNLIERSKTEE